MIRKRNRSASRTKQAAVSFTAACSFAAGLRLEPLIYQIPDSGMDDHVNGADRLHLFHAAHTDGAQGAENDRTLDG